MAATRTDYLITDRRILRSVNGRVTIIDLRTNPQVRLLPEDGGRGTLILGSLPEIGSEGEMAVFDERAFMLEHIPDAAAVYALLTGKEAADDDA